MAIISRIAGVMLLLGVLPPANASAAEPTYEDYVAQAKAGKVDLDYTAFRLAYAASPKYQPYGQVQILVKSMQNTFGNGDCAAAMKQAQEVLELNYVQVDAHFVAGECHRKAGNEDGARREDEMFFGLMRSVMNSGDGKSPKTAFVVIAIDEEYKAMTVLSLIPGRQSLVSEGTSSFDRFDAKKRDSGEPVTLYFNVDLLMAGMKQSLEPKKP